MTPESIDGMIFCAFFWCAIAILLYAYWDQLEWSQRVIGVGLGTLLPVVACTIQPYRHPHTSEIHWSTPWYTPHDQDPTQYKSLTPELIAELDKISEVDEEFASGTASVKMQRSRKIDRIKNSILILLGLAGWVTLPPLLDRIVCPSRGRNSN